MASLVLTRETLPAFRARLEAIRPDSRPLWGTMNAPRMLAHLTQTFRISLREVEVVDGSNWFLRLVLPLLASGIVPMARNIKAPAIFNPPAVGEFEQEKAELYAAMDRFLDAAEKTPERVGISPMFGPIPLRTWRKLNAAHMAHHLKQFGV